MRLLTLEGLPRTCTDLARILGTRGKTVLTIPATLSPTATSSNRAKRDEIASSFAGVLAKAKLLQRVATTPATSTWCCAHWIDLPLAITYQERCALFDVFMDVSESLLHSLDIHVQRHDVLVLDTDPHECFETLLETMEARDLTYHDLTSHLTFLKHHVLNRRAVQIVPCPPRIADNMFELFQLGKSILLHGFPSHRDTSHSI